MEVKHNELALSLLRSDVGAQRPRIDPRCYLARRTARHRASSVKGSCGSPRCRARKPSSAALGIRQSRRFSLYASLKRPCSHQPLIVLGLRWKRAASSAIVKSGCAAGWSGWPSSVAASSSSPSRVSVNEPPVGRRFARSRRRSARFTLFLPFLLATEQQVLEHPAPLECDGRLRGSPRGVGAWSPLSTRQRANGRGRSDSVPRTSACTDIAPLACTAGKRVGLNAVWKCHSGREIGHANHQPRCSGVPWAGSGCCRIVPSADRTRLPRSFNMLDASQDRSGT
jgi:hypothetical protein